MSTITEEDKDLSWVTFSGDDGQACGAYLESCPREAVISAVFTGGAACPRYPGHKIRYCAAHRDWTAEKVAKGSLFHCPACGEDYLAFLRWEPQ